MPIWKNEMGVTPIQAGLLGSAGFFGFGLMALPAAIWLTKYNARKITLACALGMVAMAILQALATNSGVLLAGRVIFVVLTVARLQIQVMFFQQWFQPRLYSIANSIDFSSRTLGQVLATAITPVLAVMLGGWRHYYIGIAAAITALAVVWAFMGRERQRPARATASSASPAADAGNPARVLRKSKTLWLIAGCQMGQAAAFASIATFYPTYAIDRLGISITTAGLLMSLFPLGSIAGSIFSGAASQAVGLRKPFIWIPGVLLPAMYLAVLYAGSMPLIVLLLLASGFFSTVAGPVLFVVPLDLGLKPREVTVAFGLIRTLFPVGATIGPLFVGFVLQVTGSLLLGLSLVAPLAITLFIGGILLPETGPKGRRRAESV